MECSLSLSENRESMNGAQAGVRDKDTLYGHRQAPVRLFTVRCVCLIRRSISQSSPMTLCNIILKFVQRVSHHNRTPRYLTWLQTGHIRTDHVSYLWAQMTIPIRKSIWCEGPFLAIFVRQSILPFGALPGVLVYGYSATIDVDECLRYLLKNKKEIALSLRARRD